MNSLFIIFGLIIVVVIYFISTYNLFILLQTRIREALAAIDVQLKRRSDLIPNLVETVKGYAKHESRVFDSVTKARASLVSAQSINEKAEANNQLTNALKSVFAVAEAYPELKASDNFKELQDQLEDTEDKVAYSRQFYNANVLDYNTRIKTIPSNFIAQAFGFKEEAFFQASEEDRKKVDVKFE